METIPAPDALKPNKLEVAFGGRDVEVMHHDGTKEMLRVRILPMRMARHYIARHLDRDHQGVVELCIGKSEEWDAGLFKDTHYADNFRLEEQERLLEICDTLNFTSAARWATRAAKSSEGLSPLLEEMYRRQAEPMKKAITEAFASVISQLAPALSSGKPLTPSSISPSPSSS